MLGERSAQRGLFEADQVYGGFVGAKTFYGFLAAQRGTLFRDEDFAGLYHPQTGRPSVPPSLLATALVLQSYDRVSDEEARERATYDLRWKVALGIELESRPFAKSTLQEFRAQLIVHEKQAAIFERSLALARQRGGFGTKRQLKLALDTTPILGRGAVKDTYNLLGDGIALVLRTLARQAGESAPMWAARHGLERYVNGQSLKGQAQIDWDSAAARRAFLQQVVAHAEQVLELVRQARQGLEAGSPADAALTQAAGLLSRVLAQDIEHRDDGAALIVGVAPERLVSIHDPEMRHGRKSRRQRFDGHKAQLAVDTESQLITAVDVIAGNGADAVGALGLVEQSETNTGGVVAETLADGAYGDGRTRQGFADAGRRLVVAPPSEQNGGRFTKSAFRVDLQGARCVCPAGQSTTTLHRLRKGWRVFRFTAAVCGPCPLQARCLGGQGPRSIAVHPQEALLQAARAEQATPEGRATLLRRQAVEHRIARLVQLGIRQARYRGRAKTRFQLLMAAAVANLTLLAGSLSPVSAFASALRSLWRAGEPFIRFPQPADSTSGSLRRLHQLLVRSMTRLALPPQKARFRLGF